MAWVFLAFSVFQISSIYIYFILQLGKLVWRRKTFLVCIRHTFSFYSRDSISQNERRLNIVWSGVVDWEFEASGSLHFKKVRGGVDESQSIS